ncbi:MAG: hypothetical protein IRY94_14250 [Rhodospirillaceae bacterium]|nr:hypothetical protein [Rhodospirillaceae bacterium]
MRFLRYFIVVVIAGAAVLAILIDRSHSALAPACDDSAVQERLKSIVADVEHQRAKPAVLAGIDAVKETAYDPARDLRTCAAVARFTAGEPARLTYTTEWEDRSRRRFAVMLQPYGP